MCRAGSITLVAEDQLDDLSGDLSDDDRREMAKEAIFIAQATREAFRDTSDLPENTTISPEDITVLGVGIDPSNECLTFTGVVPSGIVRWQMYRKPSSGEWSLPDALCAGDIGRVTVAIDGINKALRLCA